MDFCYECIKENLCKSIWAYSGHCIQSVENLSSFMNFLEENGVDLKENEVRSSKKTYYENPVSNIMASHPPERSHPPSMVEENKATSRPSSQTEADEANNVHAEQARPTYQRMLSGGM